MDTDTVVIVNGEKHYRMEDGDEIKEGDIYETSAGLYKEAPLTGQEVPGDHVNYFRPVRNVNQPNG